VGASAPPRKRRKRCGTQGRLSCYPFDKYRPLPDAKEVARLRALNQDGEEWQEERKKTPICNHLILYILSYARCRSCRNSFSCVRRMPRC
jgi:hypothetical protein